MSSPAQTFASTSTAQANFNCNNGQPISKYIEPRPEYTIIKSKEEAIRIFRVLEKKREAALQVAADGRTRNLTQSSFIEHVLVRVERKLKHLKLFIRSRDQLDEMVGKLVNDGNLQGARAVAFIYNKCAASKF